MGFANMPARKAVPEDMLQRLFFHGSTEAWDNWGSAPVQDIRVQLPHCYSIADPYLVLCELRAMCPEIGRCLCQCRGLLSTVAPRGLKPQRTA